MNRARPLERSFRPSRAQSATGISNAGHVVGRSGIGSVRGFLWLDGQMTELPPLPGYETSLAVAVNSSGHVVGSSRIHTGGVQAHVLWRDGAPTEIAPSLDP